jgi:DNA-binding NtrC family response regulator
MKTILVVDNAPAGRDRIVDILNKCGYQVIVTQTGAEALSALRDDVVIDLIISEYQMPDMDGIFFVATVKTLFPGLPVIMVTACSSIETYIKTLSLGVFEYMNKPVVAHELRRVVQAAMDIPLEQSRQLSGPALRHIP